MKSFGDKNGVSFTKVPASLPSMPNAIQSPRHGGGMVATDQAATADGVVIPTLVLQWNASRDSWSVDKTDARLAIFMRCSHEKRHDAAEVHCAPVNHIPSANVAGFAVAGSRRMQGLI